MITALGTGIGPEEFDADKIRYHKIVIMTDADVDGSHIRTLLLTFFFRQMAAIVERGYLYVAQPPLYRIQKGKKEQYLKDEGAMDEWLLAHGTANAKLVAGATLAEGADLKKLAESALAYKALLARAERRRDGRILDAAVREGDIDLAFLKSSRSEEVPARIAEVARRLHPEIDIMGSRAVRDTEHDCWSLEFKTIVQGAARETVLDFDFVSGPEWLEISALWGDLAILGEPPFKLRLDGGEQEVGDVFEAVEALKRAASQGQTIQRYKGLGEMNPEQLWETTMDPTKRTLLQVRVDDTVEADEIFSVLMGDAVELRREFIEKHALDAELDV
jgi:DNA gyrase subunit B